MAEVRLAYDDGWFMEVFFGWYVASDMADVVKGEYRNESDNA